MQKRAGLSLLPKPTSHSGSGRNAGLALLIVLCLAGGWSNAAVLTEDFSTDPVSRGWTCLGDASLFQWNSNSQRLEATWDSSHSNSFFCRFLPSLLSKTDDFTFAFDLRLSQIIGGARDEKRGPFEIAVGLLNVASATNAGFVRGSVPNFPNLCEFDYFPGGWVPPGLTISPTISPMMTPTNGDAPATSMTFPMELTTGDWFHITLTYVASNRTLNTTMTRNGEVFGPIRKVVLNTTFADFRLDAISITSYSDAGDPFGSVFARGEIDNVMVLLPDPPRPALTGGFSNRVWFVQFQSRSNWVHALERSDSLTQWQTASPPASGNGGILRLTDSNQCPEVRGFYRVQLWKQ